MSRPVRHNKRNAPPVRGRPAGVGCPVGQDHVTLALASLPIGFDAVVADLGPRRRLAPAVRLAGDVGAIAALSPLVPPLTSDYVSWALLAFRAAGHRHLQEPIDALRVPRCL